jgi:hypothetical protein
VDLHKVAQTLPPLAWHYDTSLSQAVPKSSAARILTGKAAHADSLGTPDCRLRQPGPAGVLLAIIHALYHWLLYLAT